MKKCLLLAVTSLLLVLGVAVGPASAATALLRVGAFAEQGPDGSAHHQGRIAVNHASGDVYVADQQNDRVSVYRQNGTGADLLTSFGSGDLTDPYGIAIDQDNGSVYVSDADGVTKYDSDGAATPAFTVDAGFASITATGPLAFDQGTDALLLADTGVNVVRRYSATGAPGATFDGTGSPDTFGTGSTFTLLQDLAVDSTGDVIVIDAQSDPGTGGTTRIERFSSAGTWEATIGPVEQAATVGVYPNNDDVIIGGNQDSVNLNEWPTLSRFSAAGADLGAIPTDGSIQWSTTTGIAADDGPTGRLHLATDVSAGTYVGGYGLTSIQNYDQFEIVPEVSTSAAVTGARAAKLLGRVNAKGEATTYWFEYGTDTTYGTEIPVRRDASAGADTTPRIVAQSVRGLQPSTTYHFRLVATNTAHTAMSEDRVFRTAAEPTASVRRAYEQVSPADKNGGSVLWKPIGNVPGIGLTAGSIDGDTVVFPSFGIFAGSADGIDKSYVSKRTARGWVTVPGSPPLNSPSPDAFLSNAQPLWYAAASDLSRGVMHTTNAWSALDTNTPADPPYADEPSYTDLYVRNADLTTDLESVDADGVALGGVNSTRAVGINRTGTATQFSTTAHVVPEDANRFPGYQDLYQRRSGVTRLMGIAPDGGPAGQCGSAAVELQGDLSLADPTGWSTSDDGRLVVFRTPGDTVGAPTCPSGNTPRFFVRIDGERTVELTESRRTVPDPRPYSNFDPAFLGASADGKKVFFQTPYALTDDAATNNLINVYEYRVDDDSLRLLPLAPETDPTIRTISADGTHIYFTSRGVLAPGATQDRVNLYVWADGQFAWIATGDDFLPADLGTSQMVSTEGGSSLMFTTDDDLTGYDSNGFDQVYLYREGEGLVCVSCGTASGGPRTNARMADAGRYASSLSGDGQRVVFDTGEALVPTDTNGQRDIYEWAAGSVSLVTSGTGTGDSYLLGMSRDTRDVFFGTYNAVIPQDRDGGDFDIYDARLGGGFATDEAAAGTTCEGDACQGPATASPPSAPVAGSRVFKGPEASTKQPARPKAGGFSVPGTKSANGTRTTLRVKVPGPGTIALSGPGVVRSSRTAAKSATYTLNVVLTNKSKTSMKTRKVVKVKLLYTPKVGRAVSKTVTVTFRKPKRQARKSAAAAKPVEKVSR